MFVCVFVIFLVEDCIYDDDNDDDDDDDDNNKNHHKGNKDCFILLVFCATIHTPGEVGWSAVFIIVVKPVCLTLCQAGTLGGHTGPLLTVSTGTHGLATTTGSCIIVLYSSTVHLDWLLQVTVLYSSTLL